MKQVTTSVGFQDPFGALISLGDLILDLTQDGVVITGGGQIANRRVVLPLDAAGKITPTNIWFNDELTPANTTYRATLMDNNLNMFTDFGRWSIVGASADLSTILPVTP